MWKDKECTLFLETWNEMVPFDRFWIHARTQKAHKDFESRFSLSHKQMINIHTKKNKKQI